MLRIASGLRVHTRMLAMRGMPYSTAAPADGNPSSHWFLRHIHGFRPEKASHGRAEELDEGNCNFVLRLIDGSVGRSETSAAITQ